MKPSSLQRFLPGTLRSRLAWLVALAVLPALLLQTYISLDRQRNARARAEDGLLQLTQLIADSQKQRIASTRDLMAALSRLPEVQSLDPVPCYERLAALRPLYPQYAGIAVFDLNGDSVCASSGITSTINVADRLYFQRAVETQQFAVGEFQIGRNVGRPVLAFGHPVFAADGRLGGVLLMSIELAALNEAAASTPLPAAAVLTMVDRNGLIMVREPDAADWIGQPLPEAALANALRGGAGVLTAADPDGVERLYAYAPLEGLPNVELYVTVGLPLAVAYAEANQMLARNLAWGGALALLVVLVTWAWSRAFILWPVQALMAAAARLRAGDLSARTRLGAGTDELSRLGSAFDQMAEALAAREADVHAAKQLLDKSFASLDQAVVVTDPATRRILSANPAVERIFGYRLEDVVGRTSEFVHVDRARWEQFGQDVVAALEQRGMYRTELDLRRQDGTLFPAELTITDFRDGAGQRAGMVSVVRDISERRQYERSLQAASQAAEAAAQRLGVLSDASAQLAASLDVQATLRAVVRQLLPRWADYCGIFLLDEAGRLASVASGHVDPAREPLVAEMNAVYPQMADQPHNILGRVVRTAATVHVPRRPPRPDALPPEQAALWRLVDALAPVAVLGVPLVARGRALGALMLAMAESGRPFAEADVAMLEELAQRAAVALDNARLFAQAQRFNLELEQRVEDRTRELRASEAALLRESEARQRAQQQLEHGREAERARIAREVHDELGGTLTALKMGLHRLRRMDGVPLAAQDLLGQLSGEIDDSAQVVRRIAQELRPAVLDDFGLVAALEWQFIEFRKRSGLDGEWRCEVETLALPNEAAIACFRIFQEALTNVARHAQASRVVVTVRREPGALVLQVTDDGRGLPPDGDITGRLGLVGMRERAALLSGTLTLDSAPEQGTTVTLRVPLQDEQ